MAKKKYTPEKIIGLLREAELAVNQGQTVAQACRKISVTEQTYYRWRKEYGGMGLEQARRIKELERENPHSPYHISPHAKSVVLMCSFISPLFLV